MDDVSDGGDVSPTSTPSTGYTSHTSILFGASLLPSRELRLLHHSSDHMFLLCDIYARQFEPMFKLMHVPTLRKLVTNAAANIHDIPSGNYVEPVLFAMYYAAITALTPEECLQYFQDGRELLLARYRMGAETALVNADLLNTTELGTVQALVIFIVSRFPFTSILRGPRSRCGLRILGTVNTALFLTCESLYVMTGGRSCER